MRRSGGLIPFFVLSGLSLAGCHGAPPPSPAPAVVYDTVVVAREVSQSQPDGEPVTLCLATGDEVGIFVTTSGDTLVGPRRVPLRELPGVAFAGDYAAREAWFGADAPLTFDGRRYDKFGTERSLDCDEVEAVGVHDGVNLFADVGEAAPYEMLYVPVRPGVFQPYRTDVGAVRG